MINMTIGKVDCADSHKSAICSLSVAIPKFVWLMLFLMCSLVLSGCSAGHDRDFYVRVTVDATFNGRPVSGSSVVLQPWIHSAPRGYTQGEAVSIDLGGGKKVYMVHVSRQYRRLYAPAIWRGFHHIHNPEGKKRPREEEENALLGIPYGTKVQWHYNKVVKGRRRGEYPLLVGFKDVNNPGSVFMVETESPARIFGGTFRLKGIYFERVPPDTPLTSKLYDELPWTDRNHPYWRRHLEAGGRGNKLCNSANTKDLKGDKPCGLTRSHFQYDRGN